MTDIGKRNLAGILAGLLTPIRGITDPFFRLAKNMDTHTVIAKKLGMEISQCKYCKQYFPSLSPEKCEKSPTGSHLADN